MEKKYLIVKCGDRELGAFENVTRFEEDKEAGTLKFTSDEGSFEYERNEYGFYTCEDCFIKFDSYQYCGRRTLNNHCPEEQRQRQNVR